MNGNNQTNSYDLLLFMNVYVLNYDTTALDHHYRPSGPISFGEMIEDEFVSTFLCLWACVHVDLLSPHTFHGHQCCRVAFNYHSSPNGYKVHTHRNNGDNNICRNFQRILVLSSISDLTCVLVYVAVWSRSMLVLKGTRENILTDLVRSPKICTQ